MKIKPEAMRKHVRINRPFLAKPREYQVQLKVRHQYFSVYRGARKDCLRHARWLRIALANLINDRS